MTNITLQGLEKRYGETTAVGDVSVEIDDGELLCLLGPSGSGKSTTLRMLAGLETPTEGAIRLDGEDVTDQPAYDRNTSTVFQDWALFPHKTVLECRKTSARSAPGRCSSASRWAATMTRIRRR